MSHPLRAATLLSLALVQSALMLGCAGDDAGRGGEPRSAEDLTKAAAAGDVAGVRRLLSEGSEIDARDGLGRTAVTAAAMNQHVEVVAALVAAGADVDIQDDDRNNPLSVAGENGNVALLREVLRGDPDLGATNRFGGTALIPASDRGHVDMVRALLQTEIPVDHINEPGWTALLEAVILGDGGPRHQEIVRALIGAGADVTIADRRGVTPLDHARERGYRVIVRLLSEAQPTPSRGSACAPR